MVVPPPEGFPLARFSLSKSVSPGGMYDSEEKPVAVERIAETQ